jgi:hypothetical protein
VTCSTRGPFLATSVGSDRMRTQLDRLARAVHLEVARHGGGDWLVTDGAQPHVGSAAGQCDCLDASLRRVACKHVLAARLAAGDTAMLRAVRPLVPPRHRRPGR